LSSFNLKLNYIKIVMTDELTLSISG